MLKIFTISLYLIYLDTYTGIHIDHKGFREVEKVECSVVCKVEKENYYMLDSLLGTGQYDTISARSKKQALKKYLND